MISKFFKKIILEITVLNLFLTVCLTLMTLFLFINWDYVKIAQDLNFSPILIFYIICILGLILDFFMRKVIKSKMKINLLNVVLCFLLLVAFYKILM